MFKRKEKTAGKHVFIKAETVETTDENGNITRDEEKLGKIIEQAVELCSNARSTKKSKVYAISQDGLYKKFESISDAAREYGLLTVGIIGCLSGKNRFTGDYTFVRAEDVETQNEDGSVEINEEKIKELCEIAQKARLEAQNNHTKSIYSIDKEGNLQKFESITDAAKTYGILRSNISSCVSGKKKTAGGYVFVSSDRIETQNEDGESVIDKDKLKKFLESIKGYHATAHAGEAMPIYAIHKNGGYRKFETVTSAAQEEGISYNGIADCLSGKKLFSGDYTFIRAEDVEIQNEDGSVEVNEEKIKELCEIAQKAMNSSRLVRGKAIYAIDTKEGLLQKFESSAKASTALNIPLSNISACATGTNKTCRGYTFASSDKVETENEDGTIRPDYKKIRTLFEERNLTMPAITDILSLPVYAIDSKGNHQRFNSIQEAEEKLGIGAKYIINSIRCPDSSTAGLAFIKAEDVEIQDEEGMRLKEAKFEHAVIRAQCAIKSNGTNAIYIITRGKKTRFDSISAASQELNIPFTVLNSCLDKSLRREGIAVIKASEIEVSSKDGEIVLAETRLNKILQTIDENTARYREGIYTLDKVGRPTRYNSPQEAAEATGASVEDIKACLKGEKKSANSYIFVQASEIEDEDDYLEFSANKEKLRIWKIHAKRTLEEHGTKKANGAKRTEDKRTKYVKLGRIYAVKSSGDYLEFKNLEEAALELCVEEEKIYSALKNNGSINGLLFTCDSFS